jgi:hypothetical protein
MPEHKDLTGADLHEPKGVDVASAGQVYLADGLGSGSWSHTQLKVHGEMFIVSNTTAEVTPTAADATLNTDSDYTKIITGWSTGHVDGGIVFSTDELVVPYDGEYNIAAWACIKVGANNQTVAMKYAINDTAPFSTQKLISTGSATGHHVAFAGHATVTLTANDTVSLYMATDLAADPTVVEAGLTIALVETA